MSSSNAKKIFDDFFQNLKEFGDKLSKEDVDVAVESLQIANIQLKICFFILDSADVTEKESFFSISRISCKNTTCCGFSFNNTFVIIKIKCSTSRTYYFT